MICLSGSQAPFACDYFRPGRQHDSGHHYKGLTLLDVIWHRFSTLEKNGNFFFDLRCYHANGIYSILQPREKLP